MAQIDKLRPNGFPLRSRRRARLCGVLSIAAAAVALLVLLGRSGQAEPLATPRQTTQLTAAAIATASSQDAGKADAGSAAAATDTPQQGGSTDANDNGGSPGGSSSSSSAGSSSTSNASSSGGQAIRTGVWFEVEQGEGKPPIKLELVDEPVPEDCHMEEHADYDGPALTWGLTYKKASAAQCCQACREFQPQPDGQRCNVWVYCGSRTGECWSPDIWNHTTGECWLKYQAGWDNVVDRQRTNLAVNRRGPFSDDFRNEHRTAPEAVQWTAGVIPSGR